MRTPFDIGLSNSKNVFFIAEAGLNHNGCVKNAKRLIDLAHRAGAHAIKFRKRNIKKFLAREGLDILSNSPSSTANLNREFLELDKEQFIELKQYADKVGIILTASAWDEESVDFLYDLGVPFFKIASADLTNFPLLEHTAKKGLPLVISTGMADMDTVKEAYELVSIHNNKVAILQCTAGYPTLPQDINLNVIKTYQTEFSNAIIGYSGNERGLTITLGAVALGAQVIQRYITLDRTMNGESHHLALEEPDLVKLIKDIRIMEIALGSNNKRKLQSEEQNFAQLSKSLVSSKNIIKGEIIKREHLTTKIPGNGISPMRLYYIIGKTASKDILKDKILYEKDFI